MSNIPASRGAPQTTDIAQQTVLPLLGNATRDSLDMVLAAIDSTLAKMFEDRNVLLTGGGSLLFTGGTNTLSMSEALKLEINSKIAGGAPVVIDLAATSRLFTNDGAMLYAVIDRVAGTATVTADAAALPAVTNANQEVFLIAKRRDGTGPTKRIYFRDGTVVDADKAGNLDNRAGASSVSVDNALPLLGTAANESLMNVLTAVDSDLAKLYENVNLLLTQGGTLTFTGTSLQFTEALKLEVNSKIAGGAPVIIDLGSATRAFTADGAMLYAVIDRVAGTATVTADAATLPSVVAANIEVFLIAKRRDTGGGLKRLYFRNGMALDEGQSASLGASGSGSGSGNSTLETLKNQFVDSPFELLTPNIFSTDAATKIDGASTGAYSLVSKTFVFSGAAQTLISTQSLDSAEFLVDALDVGEIDLSVFWKAGAVDTAATYQVSRNGGTEYQTVTMSRVGSTEVYRGSLAPASEAANGALSSNATLSTTQAFNATTQQKLAQSITLASTSVIRQVQVNFNKSASPVGSVFVQIVKDAAGSPSTSDLDVLVESSAVDVAGLAAGDSLVSVAMPRTVLAAGTYHLVLRSDAAYKAGSLTLNWRSNGAAGTGARKFDGSAWTSITTNTFGYSLDGYILDLRVKITSSAGSKELSGYGIFYKKSSNGFTGVSKKIERRVFNSVTDNLSTFTLVNYLPDPDLLTVYWVEGGQAFKWPSFSISGYQVTFPTNTFYNGGVSQTITLVFDQTGGNSFDNTDSNSNGIATLNNWAGSGFVDDVVLLNKIAAPFTTIVNRAKMVDLSTDLSVRMGIERIQVQQIMRVDGEIGPAGEVVFKPVNDKYDQIRFVGSWSNANGASWGPAIDSASNSNFAEITFYGTSLNIMFTQSAAAATWQYSLNGGADTTFASYTASGILSGRNYCGNQVVSVIPTQTLGLHTVRVKTSSGAGQWGVTGFEILNESSSIKVTPGSSATKGKKLTLSSAHSSAYNSGFSNVYGTAGTKGGRVLVYQKSDGTIGKDIQWVNTASATLTSTDHSNEEVIRNYFWREFGCGGSGDFSTLTPSVRAQSSFTADDGSTIVLAAGSHFANATVPEAVNINSNGGSVTIDFIGTGLDIIEADSGTGSGDTYNFSIDGGSTIAMSGVGSTTARVIKIVSGLPYGQHVIKFTRVTATVFAMGIANFIVYGPKKPSLPAGAVELADYNILADYVANSTAGLETIATGAIRKSSIRELVYKGTGWSLDSDTSYLNGNNVFGGTAVSDYFEYTFFGTGIEYRLRAAYGNSPTLTITDLATNSTVNLASYTTGFYGVTSFTAGSGVINTAGGSNNAGVKVSGLPLKAYKVRVTNNNAGTNLSVLAIDVITPIHVHKNNGPFVLQNTLSVGSQGINDSRKFGSQLTLSQSTVAQTQQISSNLTTSTTFTPTGELATTVYASEDASYLINLTMTLRLNAVVNAAYMAIHMDGVQQPLTLVEFASPVSNSLDGSTSTMARVFLTKGYHHFMVFWRAGSGSVTSFIPQNGNCIIGVSKIA
jgi:flagellar hook-basal body complex protein FliE